MYKEQYTMALLKAFIYKSFFIYKSSVFLTISSILWTCLLLLFFIALRGATKSMGTSLDDEPFPTFAPLIMSNVLLLNETEQQKSKELQSTNERVAVHPVISLPLNINDSEPYFTDKSFKQKVMSIRSSMQTLKKHARFRRNLDKDNPQITVNFPRQIYIMNYGLVFVTCFITSWTKSGKLAQAERISGSIERMRLYGTNDIYIILGYVFHAAIEQFISSLICTFLVRTSFGSVSPLIENLDFVPLFVSMFFLNIPTTIFFITISSFFNSVLLRNFASGICFFYFFALGLKFKFSVVGQVFANMFPPFGVCLSMGTASAFELNGGFLWKSLVSANSDTNDLPLLVVLLSMIIGSCLMLLVSYYMMNVKPGKYGVSRHCFFFLPQSFQGKWYQKIILDSGNKIIPNSRKVIKEKTSTDIKVGIKIKNLHKKICGINVLRNLSMDIYSGQITALLGHNGAGKTTMLSILSGMMSPSSGSAEYEDYNIFTNLKRFRTNLGLCPQSNLLHPELNVINQLIFFGMVTGLSRKEAEENGVRLLKLVGISEKSDATIKELSGGMQRKLCIALALLGDPNVLILDEPTSGIDPQSRREIWNILLESRGEKVIIISTHFMEEADVLGDQIAIMGHGELICYGTPLYLKKRFGAGYQVTVSTNPSNFDRIQELFNSKISETTVLSNHEEWIKLKLPIQKAKMFPDLFKVLESDEEVTNIIINCTTIEDVFLKIKEEAIVRGSNIPKALQKYNRGFLHLDYCSNIFIALVMKRLAQVLTPLTVFLLNFMPFMAAYFTHVNHGSDFMAFLRPDTTESKSNFSSDIYNFEGSGDFGKDESNHTDLPEDCYDDPFSFIKNDFFSTSLTMMIVLATSIFINFTHEDRISSVKHLMLMTGISPIKYWFSILFLDMIILSIFLFLYHFLLRLSLHMEDDFYTVPYFILVLCCLCLLTTIYFITFLFDSIGKVVTFHMSGVITSGLLSCFIVQLDFLQPYASILKIQSFTAVMGLISSFLAVGNRKSQCIRCPYSDCDEILTSSYFDDENLWSDFKFVVGDIFFYMLIVLLIEYGFFPFVWDRLSSLWIGRVDYALLTEVDSDVAKERNRVYDNIKDGEKLPLTSYEPTPNGDKLPLAIVDGLAKKHFSNMTAVYDVTFAVTTGECFGLLGVNGSGKTTTFKMLTGMSYPTEGNVYIKGHSLRNNKSKYLSCIGYCPQQVALLNNLTGRQMLHYFAQLRHLQQKDIRKESDKWISLFGLEDCIDNKCSTYSGGTKKKVNAAMAFIGDASVILLDEPTTGVDPYIRKKLWSVINECGSTNQAIIISSHSMLECEAVCDRLTIMAGGKMECVGNIHDLKSMYGKGYVIMIKLKAHDKNDLVLLKKRISNAFGNDCRLRDEHKVLLHYHVTTFDYKIWQLFSILETIKEASKIVDDYIITNSSLEEVFLSFAKNQKE